MKLTAGTRRYIKPPRAKKYLSKHPLNRKRHPSTNNISDATTVRAFDGCTERKFAIPHQAGSVSMKYSGNNVCPDQNKPRLALKYFRKIEGKIEEYLFCLLIF